MLTLTEKFVRVCLDFSEREVMRVKSPSGWSVYRYRDLLTSARKVANWLMVQGIGKGERVAVIFDNTPQWSIAYFGVLLAGGVCVPLDPQSSRQDIVTFVEDAGVSFVFMENRLLELLQHHLRQVKKIVVVKKEKGLQHCVSLDEIILTTKDLKDFRAAACEPEDTASLIYSSGTTANPKGVELSHRNFYSNFESLSQLGVCTAEDSFISILPLFHAFSFMSTLIYPLFLGARIVYPKTIKSTELAEIMKETGTTMLVGVPELFSAMHKSIMEKIREFSLWGRILLNAATQASWLFRKRTGINLSKIIYQSAHERLGGKIRYIVSGGARLDPQVAIDFEKFGFTVLEGYGLTETSPVASLNPPNKSKAGSVGKPLPGVSVRIENPDAEGVGEIVISGPNVMKGYYQKPEETKQVFSDSWFHSGDLGYFDKEGYLYISGRLKEVVVLGSGKNIFPDEVEKYYCQSKYIKECGVFLSGAEKGTGNLKAVVVPNFDMFKKSGQINIEEKIRWDMENISRELASYKRVMGFAISKEELPKTRLGKIKRYQLPQIYTREALISSSLKEEASAKAKHAPNPILERIAELLQKEMFLEELPKPSDHLELDLGIDSLGRVELITSLEKTFRLHFPDDVLQDVGTLEELAEKVDGLLRNYVATYENEEVAKEFGVASWHNILHKESKNKELESMDLNPTAWRRAVGYILKAFIFIIFKIFFRLKIIGKKNLPNKGPYMICCNHASFLDAFVVIAGLPFEVAFQTYFIGLKEIFDLPAFRWSIKFAQVIPIDPTTELVRAMQAASLVLRNGKILCIFPEGQRSIDGEVKRFKSGAGILAKELDMEAVPVYIEGSHKAWPRTGRFPKPHAIKLVFGQPVNYGRILGQEGQAPADEPYKKIAEKIREDIISLQTQARKKD